MKELVFYQDKLSPRVQVLWLFIDWGFTLDQVKSLPALILHMQQELDCFPPNRFTVNHWPITDYQDWSQALRRMYHLLKVRDIADGKLCSYWSSLYVLVKTYQRTFCHLCPKVPSIIQMNIFSFHVLHNLKFLDSCLENYTF